MYNVNNSIKICRFLKFYGSFDCSSWSYDHLHISCSPENHTLLFGLYASFYGKFPWILWIFFGDFLKSGLRFRFPSRSEKLQFVCQMCSALKPPLCKGRWIAAKAARRRDCAAVYCELATNQCEFVTFSSNPPVKNQIDF